MVVSCLALSLYQGNEAHPIQAKDLEEQAGSPENTAKHPLESPSQLRLGEETMELSEDGEVAARHSDAG